jgi:hypothetical protein
VERLGLHLHVSELTQSHFDPVNSHVRISLHVEFPQKTPYAKDADEFVRLNCRGVTGWRRDEWAYSPLFIWTKLLPEMASKGREIPDGQPLGKLQLLIGLQTRIGPARWAIRGIGNDGSKAG